jgi:hypothetical protein
VPDQRKLRVVVALGAWSALAALAAPAGAAPQTFVALEYEVAPDVSGCPDGDEFRAHVDRQLGYDPFRPAADRRVAVQIARKDPGFDGRIRWTDARGRWVGDRRLTSRHSDCKEIAASLAFSVAVQVQLLATLAPAPAPAPAPTPAPTPAPAPGPATAPTASEPIATPPPPPSPPTPPAPVVETDGPPTVRRDGTDAPREPTPAPASPERRVALSLGLGPSLGLGTAPSPTGLARVFVSGRVDRLSAEIAVDAALPTTRQEGDGTGFLLDRFAGAAAGCGHASAFAGCITATVGVVRARGIGVDVPASPMGVFSQLGARIAATYAFGTNYFVAARVDGFVMLSPWTVTLNGAATWTTPRVGALLGLDLGLTFF